ncbi:MAG: hypothetical protein LCH54_05970 [Bacteroidetes bacterium]|nr:hypothetical protein [Bacteroidota bacterium]
MKIVNLLLTIFIFQILNSCSTPVSSFEYRGKEKKSDKKIFVQTISIDSVLILEKGVKIVANDNSFTLISGKKVKTPFFIDNTYYFGDVSNDFPGSIKAGAKKVKVIVEGKDKPLHGLLFFGVLPFPIINENPDFKYHTISNLGEAIENAYKGNISHNGHKVIFEENVWYNDDHPIDNVYSYILWLSLEPF